MGMQGNGSSVSHADVKRALSSLDEADLNRIRQAYREGDQTEIGRVFAGHLNKTVTNADGRLAELQRDAALAGSVA